MSDETEDAQLRSVALQNAESILVARRRAEQKLVEAKDALARKAQELSEQREWFRVTLSSIGDGVITTDVEAKVTFLNPVAESATGWRAADAVGKPLREVFRVIHEQSREPLPNPIESVLHDGLAFALANHASLVAKDGHETLIEDSAAPIRDASGNMVGAVMVFYDVTEKRRAQHALRHSEMRKASILDAALDALFTIDHQGKIGHFNHASEGILGYSREEAVNKSITHLFPPARVQEPQYQDLMRYLSGTNTSTASNRVQLHILHADGHEFPAEMSISRVSGEEPALFSASLRDITQGAEAQLLETRLAAIVESSEDAIIGKTLQGIVTSWNKSAERIFGYSSQEMIGKSIMTVIPADRQNEEAFILGRLAAGERVQNYETIRRTKDGQYINISLTSSPIRSPEGRIVGASKIARDITSRKRAEETLKKHAEEREFLLESERSARTAAERMSEMKDEFLATLSHELRTPLSAILGWAQVLKNGNINDADLQKGIDVIDRNARVQAQLIEDLLDMSRIISGKVRIDAQPMAPISAVEAAIETVRPGADAKGVRVDKLLDPAAGPITGDPARLQQVVWNLLSNAIKFTPKGGRVLVTLEKADSSVQISVADTGAGIDRAFLPHVFERFKQADASTTRHHGGLGLGLSIVKHLVELHGGTVDVESEGEDRGTKFTIRLPLSPFRLLVPDDLRDTRVRSLNAPAQYQRVNLAGIRVLVVDDVDDARELIKRVLVECDAEVTTAASAEEGLSVLATCEPDVLVSDIGMPDVDGYEFLRRLRALGGAAGKIPAVALTAFARSEDRVRALRAGYQVHVSKPVEPSELIATIASVMGRSAEPNTLQKVT